MTFNKVRRQLYYWDSVFDMGLRPYSKKKIVQYFFFPWKIFFSDMKLAHMKKTRHKICTLSFCFFWFYFTWNAKLNIAMNEKAIRFEIYRHRDYWMTKLIHTDTDIHTHMSTFMHNYVECVRDSVCVSLCACVCVVVIDYVPARSAFIVSQTLQLKSS